MASIPDDERIKARPANQASTGADDVVRLVTAPNPAQAHIWQQALRDEGIQSRVVGDYLDTGIGDIPGLRAEVWVHRSDLARAKELLDRHQGSAGSEDDEED